MNTHKKGALPDASRNTTQAHDTTIIKRFGKPKSILPRLAYSDRFHTYQAQKVSDHLLPTTARDLQIKQQIEFDKEFVRVPNRFCSESPVTEFWLQDDQRHKALEIVSLREACS